MVRRKLSYSWTDTMSLEKAEMLMAKAMDIETLRKDIIRRELYMEEYLKEYGLEEYYRSDSEIVSSAIKQSLIKSKELISEANKEKVKAMGKIGKVNTK